MPSPPIPLSAVVPELILVAATCLVLLVGQLQHGRWSTWVVLAALAASLVLVILRPELSVAGSGLAYGSLAHFVRVSVLELGILITLVNWSQPRRGGQAWSAERSEFVAMMPLALCGLLLVGAANNLVVLFLALELVSIPTYVMVVLSRTRPGALEAGTKYFYLGALSAALMAYGFSLLYGVAGTAQLAGVYDAEGVLQPGLVDALSRALQTPGTLRFGLASVGVVLSIAGLLFKIAAVPLHFYIADVYQGAASPVAGLLGFVPKLAGLLAICKVALATGHWEFGDSPVFWLLWIVAAASMCVGNVLALRQTNIKRLLGYSGIAHSGYMLVGVLAGPLAGKSVATQGVGIMGDGTAAAFYYVVIYGLANLGAFAVLALLRVRDEPCETLRDVAGLVRRAPDLALLLVLAMFTLMGLPPTPGFWGKVGLFGSALAGSSLVTVAGRDTWTIALVVLAVLNTALGAAYYLRVIAAVLVYENEHPARAVAAEARHVGALLCGFLLLIFTFWPTGLMKAGVAAARDLSPGAALHAAAINHAPPGAQRFTADDDPRTSESAAPARSGYPPH